MSEKYVISFKNANIKSISADSHYIDTSCGLVTFTVVDPKVQPYQQRTVLVANLDSIEYFEKVK